MSDFECVVWGRIVEAQGITDDAWLAINQGKILARGNGKPPQAREIIDARGLSILPGVIDGQVHSGSQANQEGLGWASRAAAAGGITVMVDMPYDDPEPVASLSQLKDKIAEVERDCHIDVALFGTLNQTQGFNKAAELIDGGVCAFKFSTFEAAKIRFPRLIEDEILEVFQIIAPSGLACGVHNQMQELTQKRVGEFIQAGDTGWDAYLRALPPYIEDLATSLIYEMGAQTGARAHAVHVSTSRGFEISQMYQKAGHHASIETCVQYLMLNHEEHTRRFGAKTKHFPPIRPRAEMEKLWSHIAQGHCTFVSSDHVSWSLVRKEDPNVFKNASGGPGLETLLPALWSGCEEHGLSPTLVAQLLCKNPAQHFLLDDRKGTFAVGADADFVLLEPGKFVFDPANSLSAVQWSSFAGRQFSIRVAGTWCRGNQVYDGQKIINSPGYGRFLRPQKK